MYPVEIYGRVRRAVLVEGRSQRSVAREFGLARLTVRKMVGYSIPPGYRRKEPAKRPKLGPWLGVIDAILEEDKINQTCQAAAHRQADLRSPAGGARVPGWLHDREGLRAHRHAAPPGDVRSAGACSGDSAGRLRRGAGDRRWRGAQGPLLRDRPAALGRRLRDGVSGGDDRSVSRKSRSGLRLFGRRSHLDSV